MMACAAENEQIHGDKQQWLGRIAILAAFCVASQVLNGGVSVRNTRSGDFAPPLCCRIARASVSAGPLCGCLCGLLRLRAQLGSLPQRTRPLSCACCSVCFWL